MRRIIPVPEMTSLIIEPIDKTSFAPFGELVDVEASGIRTGKTGGIGNLRPASAFHLSTIRITPTALPLSIVELERHAFTSQTFLPLDASRYLVCVACADAEGWPDTHTLQAFSIPANIGITYRAGIWHHPMIALDAPASFAILMWCGDKDNDAFVDLSRHVPIASNR